MEKIKTLCVIRHVLSGKVKPEMETREEIALNKLSVDGFSVNIR